MRVIKSNVPGTGTGTWRIVGSGEEEVTGLVEQLRNFNFLEALSNVEPSDFCDDEDLINEVLKEIDETGPVDPVVNSDSVKLEPVEVIQLNSEDDPESGDPPAKSAMRGSSPPPLTSVGFCEDSRNPERVRYSQQRISNPNSIAGAGAAVSPSVHRVTNAGYSGIDSEIDICTQTGVLRQQNCGTKQSEVAEDAAVPAGDVS